MRLPSMRSSVVPIGYGLVAGALGAAVQTLFFKTTSKWTPEPPKDAFHPPDHRQRSERETETVARRTVEGLMKRGPLSKEALERGGHAVHYAFGASWGAAYALWRETRGRRPTAATALGFGLFVWACSDNVILPAFRLAGWPQKYPVKTHAYAVAAHFVYGLGVWESYELLRDQTLPRVLARLYFGSKRRRTLPSLSRWLSPALAKVSSADIPRAVHEIERSWAELLA